MSGVPAAYRPRRSVLYMPSSNARALEKAKTLAVDALILDLEDAVAPDVKASAREAACAAAGSGDYGRRELTIRANGLDTEWFADDIAAIARSGAHGVVVPKVGSADEVRTIVAALDAAGAPDDLRLWAMIETPRAILDAAEIAAASTRLAALVMGTNDLVKELYARHVPGRAPLLTALSLSVLGARAAGVAILDGVFNDVSDGEGFEAECRQGRDLGFDGKTLIHPGQVDGANRVFAPSAEEVEDAHAMIEAFEAAMAQGRAVATHKGRLIENLHVETARKAIAVEEAIAALG
ncbi:CoA ester lyase [Lapillicoccus sp.]|uniref:HpcH/HpaI aldolase/citrate lyase family protein n=1 Tax=Lapillicoccus sp. TaxID=1909287 RepID=UPI0025ED72B7|nr:CoA ester lyase [Lapillicoccus sp.]